MSKYMRFVLLLVGIVMLVPNFAYAKEDNTVVLSEEVISNTVKKLVKEHGPIVQPLVIDSGLVDAEDGMKVSFYIIPEQTTTSLQKNNITIMSTTPLSAHWINQGVKMIYSKSDGTAWTVSLDTTLNFQHYNSETTSTNMRTGYKHATNAWDSYNEYGGTVNGSYRYYNFSTESKQTSIRFFITNLSAANVYVNGGSIWF